MRRWALLAALVLGVGCQEKPVQVQDAGLGISVTFPGQPKSNRFTEPTPFGSMDWFGNDYVPSGRMDESFVVQVGNLPPGDQGGSTVEGILDTYRKYLMFRFPNATFANLEKDRGPGFGYVAQAASGIRVEGLVILRKGRLHQAQAIVSKANDPRVKTFLDSFAVAP